MPGLLTIARHGPAFALTGALIGLSATGCGSPSLASGLDGFIPTRSSPGLGSGTLQVQAFATLKAAPAGLTSALFHVSVIDARKSCMGLGTLPPCDTSGATVTMGAAGRPVTLAMDTNSNSPTYGDFIGGAVGYSEYYELSVTRGSDFLHGVVLSAPSLFSVTVAPDPPAVGMDAIVHWAPFGDSHDVQVCRTFCGDGGCDGYCAPSFLGTSDNGSRLLTGSDAFPVGGAYALTVTRATLLDLPGAAPSYGTVTLSVEKDVRVQ